MNEKTLGSEMRKRIPRIIINAVVLIFLFFVLNIALLFIPNITIPGINMDVDTVFRMILMLLVLVVLARITSDAVVLADIATNMVIAHLGIKSEQPLRRVGKEAVYIIIDLLLYAAVIPFLSDIPDIGGGLVAIASLIFLGAFIILAYDMWRIIHRTLEEKTDRIAEWVAEKALQVSARAKRFSFFNVLVG